MDIFEYLITHQSKFNGKRILMAEDNEINRAIVRDILTAQNFLVEEAWDGAQAVAMVKAVIDRNEPDYYPCILMDIEMPNMDGYEATKEIRAMCNPAVHIPIIAITSNNTEADKKHCFEVGMDEHLSKPVDIVQLLATMVRYM